MQKSELQKRIEECERRGALNLHVELTPEEKIKPVTAKHKYVRKGLWAWMESTFWRTFIMMMCPLVNFFGFGLKIKGRENLKGIKNAIVISNHVHNLDNLMIRQALFGHKLYITVGAFNNRKGFLGYAMRRVGTLPFSENVKAMQNLRKAIDYYLTKNTYVLFYPEEALWHRYTKPRPHRNGAYYFAIKNNLPIVPIFITWGRGKRPKAATLHILKPVYPEEAATLKESMAKMEWDVYTEQVAKYEEFYGKKLEFTCGKENVVNPR